MKIINESIMTHKVGRKNVSLEDIILSESFSKMLNELYGIDEDEKGINNVLIACDVSQAINEFVGTAIARPIREKLSIINLLDNKEVASFDPSNSIVIEMNKNIYDITERKMYDLKNSNGLITNEGYNPKTALLTFGTNMDAIREYLNL